MGGGKSITIFGKTLRLKKKLTKTTITNPPDTATSK